MKKLNFNLKDRFKKKSKEEKAEKKVVTQKNLEQSREEVLAKVCDLYDELSSELNILFSTRSIA